MAKNGIKNTFIFFKEINSADINEASMTPHHGKNNENAAASIKVNIKLFIEVFISLLFRG